MPLKLPATGVSRRFLPALLLCLVAGEVQAACTVSATGVAFGSIDPLVPTAHQSTGTVTVTCDALTGYSVALSQGSGTFAVREMVSGAQALEYNLFRDAAENDIWGDGTGSTVTVSGSADSNGQTHTVYGLLPHQPAAVPGSYSDSITVTVSY